MRLDPRLWVGLGALDMDHPGEEVVDDLAAHRVREEDDGPSPRGGHKLLHLHLEVGEVAVALLEAPGGDPPVVRDSPEVHTCLLGKQRQQRLAGGPLVG